MHRTRYSIFTKFMSVQVGVLYSMIRASESRCDVEEWNSVEIPSRRGSSESMSGCVDYRSGFGEEDDSNTREIGGRELVLVFSVP